MSRILRRRLALRLSMLWPLPAALLMTVPAAPQSMEGEIESAFAELQDAYARNLHLISPEHYRDAEEQLTEARERYEDGDRLQDIRESLAEGRASLAEAEVLFGVGQLLLESALEARALAAAANAPEFAPEEWEEAEDKITDAGEQVEDGDQNDARARAAEAEELFRNAEYEAIRTDLIGNARQLREVALDADADDRARSTLAAGDSLMQQAENVLAGDRYQRAEASALARAAALAFERAARIADRSDTVDDDTDVEVEALMLAYEAQLATIADELGVESTFGGSATEVADRVSAAVASLQQERRDLLEELADAEITLEAARADIDSLQTRLAVQRDSLTAENIAMATQAAMRARERAEAAAALDMRRERREAIERVRANIGRDEGEVLLRGDELIIRLHGLNFAVGSDQIAPEFFPLLTRLQRSMREFPEAPVLVAGHTDSRGNEAVNQELSVQRANAVREYILANTDRGSFSVSAVGFGESQPVATNETDDGRAQNRRIDVIMTLPPLPEF